MRKSRQKLGCHCTSSRSRPIVDLSHFKGSRVTAPLQKEKKEAILEVASGGRHALIYLFFLRALLQACVAASDPQVEAKAHFLRACLTLSCSHLPSL